RHRGSGGRRQERRVERGQRFVVPEIGILLFVLKPFKVGVGHKIALIFTRRRDSIGQCPASFGRREPEGGHYIPLNAACPWESVAGAAVGGARSVTAGGSSVGEGAAVDWNEPPRVAAAVERECRNAPFGAADFAVRTDHRELVERCAAGPDGELPDTADRI